MEGMTWKDWAINEVRRAGLYKRDSDYGGELGKALEELIEVFEKQGHSGFSASLTISLFHRLVRWKPLSPITSDPSEWRESGKMNGEKVYQSRRCPSLFATESQLKQGKASDNDFYYKVDKEGRVYRDKDCSKVVNLPCYPSIQPELRR